MRQIRPLLVTLFGFLVLALTPAAGWAQSSDTFTVGLMAGLGGSLEDDPDTGLDNFNWQALFSMRIDSGTLWGARAGRLSLDGDGFDGDLNYLTLAGEYRFGDSLVDSGLFFGLGFYDLDGPRAASDTSLGATLGVTGNVGISDQWSLLLELSAHYADLDQTQFFVMGHVGLGYHF